MLPGVEQAGKLRSLEKRTQQEIAERVGHRGTCHPIFRNLTAGGYSGGDLISPSRRSRPHAGSSFALARFSEFPTFPVPIAVE